MNRSQLIASVAALAGTAGFASAQSQDTIYSSSPGPGGRVRSHAYTGGVTDSVLWSNGSVTNGVNGSGQPISQFAAPASLFGAGMQISANNAVAENFTVPAGGWNINQLTFFSYQTGATAFTFTGLNYQIVTNNADPIAWTAAGGVVNGGFVGYRVTSTTPNDTLRPIFAIQVPVAINLPAGNYWLRWQVAGTLASGPWQPPVAPLVAGNAMQSIAGAAFAPLIDTGNAQNPELPFQIDGFTGGACCLGDGGCVQAAAAACAAQNGIYRGDGVSCANANCACNTLSNGGFESGTFSGWTQVGNTGSTGVSGTFNGLPHSGLFDGYFGAVGTPGGITQVISAAAGTPLIIDFWYFATGAGAQSFAVDLSGVTLLSLANDTSHPGWTQFSIPVNAPVNNPVLRFLSRNDPAYNHLDDIRVCVGQAGCYANCDFSTTPPVLNVLDFACFLNKFASGCP